MAVKIFIHKRLRETFDPELLSKIRDQFLEYKEKNIRPKNFGRDVPYDRPQSVKDSNLWHIHLRDSSSGDWGRAWMRVYDMTSNTAIIYTRGFKDKNSYLIISIIENAHTYYGGNEKYIRAMAEIALDFQKYY